MSSYFALRTLTARILLHPHRSWVWNTAKEPDIPNSGNAQEVAKSNECARTVIGPTTDILGNASFQKGHFPLVEGFLVNAG